MLTLPEYNEQIPNVRSLLTKWAKVERIQNVQDGLQLDVRLKTDTLLELHIYYDHVYHVPSIKFRLWSLDTEEDISSLRLLTLSDSELRSILNLGTFSVTLSTDMQMKSVYYYINNCDTDANVGSDVEHYLTRWISLYIRIFDLNFVP